MEQLTQFNGHEVIQTGRGRMVEVAMLKKKVEIRLGQSQFESFDRLMVLYLATTLFNNSLLEKANYFIIHQVYEKKIRPKHLDLKPIFKLLFTIPEAVAVDHMLRSIRIPTGSTYELTLRDTICSEIDHQTA